MERANEIPENPDSMTFNVRRWPSLPETATPHSMATAAAWSPRVWAPRRSALWCGCDHLFHVSSRTRLMRMCAGGVHLLRSPRARVLQIAFVNIRDGSVSLGELHCRYDTVLGPDSTQDHAFEVIRPSISAVAAVRARVRLRDAAWWTYRSRRAGS